MLQADRFPQFLCHETLSVISPHGAMQGFGFRKATPGQARSCTGQVKLSWSRLMAGTLSDYTQDLQLSLSLRHCLTA